MLPSIDTYLHGEIEDKLKIIQSSCYIMGEILKDIQPEVARNFIRTYCGDKGREIPIVYTMPQEKMQLQGSIYIGLRQGAEEHQSIGNIEETYFFKEDGAIRENAIVQVSEDNTRLCFDLSKEIGELINVEGLAFSDSDNVTIEDGKLYFRYDPNLIGTTFAVHYTAVADSDNEDVDTDEQGLKKGFSTIENYSILALSTNMDTVRCIDLILKAILIMMRDNPNEKGNYLLQRLQFGQIDEVDTEVGNNSDARPMILYGRETIVTYTTSYSLDIPLENKIKELILDVSLD